MTLTTNHYNDSEEGSVTCSWQVCYKSIKCSDFNNMFLKGTTIMS